MGTNESGRGIRAGFAPMIQIGGTPFISTVGCCGMSVNRKGVTEHGIIIAGHGGKLYDRMVLDGQVVGTVSSRMYEGPCDISFVALDPECGRYPTRNLSDGLILDGMEELGIGDIGREVEFHGGISGVLPGVVDNVSFSFESEGIRFRDMLRVKVAAKAGDSGGALVTVGPGKSRKLLGILSSTGGGYANFTKPSNLVKYFHFELY